MTAGWLTAETALARLGVRPQTLYAYVSRGRVQARPDPQDPRRSLYAEPDVQRLEHRRRTGRRPSAVAASALAWGEPVMASAVSTIRAGRLIYRGEDAVALSRHASLETAALRLWDAGDGVFGAPYAGPIFDDRPLRARPLSFLSAEAVVAPPAFGRTRSALEGEAARLTLGLVAVASGVRAGPGEPIHVHLARGWERPEAADLFRRTLVLLAEHELNVSSFAVRVTASSGASLPACLLTGAATLSGPLHGLAALAVADLTAESERDGPERALRRRLRLGVPPPGFGHPLYAGEDPRAAELLAHFEPPPAYRRLRDVAEGLLGAAPNVDFALAAMASVLGLSRGAPLRLFMAARAVGWLAHALEQHATPGLLRPRARYVGPLPPEIPPAAPT